MTDKYRLEAEKFFVQSSDMGYAERSKALVSLLERIHSEGIAQGREEIGKIIKEALDSEDEILVPQGFNDGWKTGLALVMHQVSLLNQKKTAGGV